MKRWIPTTLRIMLQLLFHLIKHTKKTKKYIIEAVEQ